MTIRRWQCEKKNIDLSFIDNQPISNLDKNNLTEEHEYLFLIKLVKTIDFISKNREINKFKINQDYILINDEINDSYYDKYIETILTLTKECNIENQFCMFSSLILKNIESNKYQGTYKSTYNFYFKLYIDSHIQFVDKTTECKFIDFLSENIHKYFAMLISDGNSTRICNLLKLIFKHQPQNQDNLDKINNYLNIIYEYKLRQHLEQCLNSEEEEIDLFGDSERIGEEWLSVIVRKILKTIKSKYQFVSH